MSDPTQTTPAEPDQELSVPVTAGSLLRQAREARGIHIAALAVSIRVPVKKLEALETDHLDQLHDPVYIRALASLVCRSLKMDPTPVLDQLPQLGAPLLRSDVADINVPFQRPDQTQSSTYWRQIPRPAVLAVLLLLTATLALLFLPESQESPPPISNVMPSPNSESAPAMSLATIGQSANSPVVQSKPAEARPAAPLRPPTVLPASLPEQPSSRGLAAPASSLAAIRVDPTALLQFKVNDESWVQVTDGRGEVLLSRNLARGETALVAKGALPIQVVVGRADVTDVWLRGKPYPLQGLSRENVARFEVGP